MKATSLGLMKPDGDDPIDIQDFNDNADMINKELLMRPLSTGSASDMTNTFSQADTLTNLTSGEAQKFSFGKIMMAIADYISHKAATATTGVLGHVRFGTTAGTACQGNDGRLSNSRKPTAHASTERVYGVADNHNYGHVLITDTYDARLPGGGASEGGGSAPSQWALADAYKDLKDEISKLNSNLTVATVPIETANAEYITVSAHRVKKQGKQVHGYIYFRTVKSITNPANIIRIDCDIPNQLYLPIFCLSDGTMVHGTIETTRYLRNVPALRADNIYLVCIDFTQP